MESLNLKDVPVDVETKLVGTDFELELVGILSVLRANREVENNTDVLID